MNRPIYENSITKENEYNVAEKIATATGGLLRKLPMQYRIDYALCDEQLNVLMFVEVKCRHIKMDSYKTFFISTSKYLVALDYATRLKIPVYFAVQWTDCLGWWRVVPIEKPVVKWDGNKQRNDGQDLEPVLHIPVEEFDIIE